MQCLQCDSFQELKLIMVEKIVEFYELTATVLFYRDEKKSFTIFKMSLIRRAYMLFQKTEREQKIYSIYCKKNDLFVMK